MIRLLDPEKENLSAFFKNFEKDSEFIKVDVDHTDKTYRELIKKGIGQVFLLFDGETLMGGLGCIKSPDLHSGELTAIETFWYVAPEYRTGFNGMELFFRFEQWAKEEGCKKIAMIHLSDSSPERLERLYARMGYKLAEKHYVKAV
jgi:GNAT superfamily N-acetyltransferase